MNLLNTCRLYVWNKITVEMQNEQLAYWYKKKYEKKKKTHTQKALFWNTCVVISIKLNIKSLNAHRSLNSSRKTIKKNLFNYLNYFSIQRQ